MKAPAWWRRWHRGPILNRGSRGNGGFLTPDLAWLLLASDLRHYADRPAGARWVLGGRLLPKMIAMGDQADALVALGWLDTESCRHMEHPDDRAQTVLTNAGRLALDLIERADHDGYDAYLRATASAPHVERDAPTATIPTADAHTVVTPTTPGDPR